MLRKKKFFGFEFCAEAKSPSVHNPYLVKRQKIPGAFSVLGRAQVQRDQNQYGLRIAAQSRHKK